MCKKKGGERKKRGEGEGREGRGVAVVVGSCRMVDVLGAGVLAVSGAWGAGGLGSV